MSAWSRGGHLPPRWDKPRPFSGPCGDVAPRCQDEEEGDYRQPHGGDGDHPVWISEKERRGGGEERRRRWQDEISSGFDRLVALASEVDRRKYQSGDKTEHANCASAR